MIIYDLEMSADLEMSQLFNTKDRRSHFLFSDGHVTFMLRKGS